MDVGGQGSERAITATLERVYYIDVDAFSTHRTSITMPHSYKRLTCHYAWPSSADVAPRHLFYGMSYCTLQSDISTALRGSSRSLPFSGPPLCPLAQGSREISICK